VVSAVRLDGGRVPTAFKGPPGGEPFAACAEGLPAPTLREGGAVAMKAAPDGIAASDASGWSGHCGYR
jgi:hypothetical protein